MSTVAGGGAAGAAGEVPGSVPGSVTLGAPAKLTLSLRVTGVRADGYHELESEMVALDLADTLTFGPGHGLEVDTAALGPSLPVGDGPDNLVARALAAVGRTARVRLVKRIPAGAGLGGGSADAAAVLRWAGCGDPAVAAGLGADVPFCVAGGRALVRGIGERLEPLPYEDRRFVLLLPPFGVVTAAVYRAWDEGAGHHGAGGGGGNDLEGPAVAVEPRLGRWREVLAEAAGVRPALAGSGSTWYVEGTPETVGLAGVDHLTCDGATARLVAVRTVPAPAG